MLKKKIFIIFFILFFCVLPYKAYSSSNCNQQGNNEEEWKQIAADCTKQAAILEGQVYDAQAQGRLLQIKHNLLVAQLKQTEQKIETTQKEIDTLENRINNLDSSLNKLTEMLRYRVVKEYKEKSVSVLTMVIDSTTANDFITHFKYLKTAQENNQRLIVQVQQQKLNFEEQKKLRDEKKVELGYLKTSLAQQQIAAEEDQKRLDIYLAQLKNNLAETQRKLDLAQAQLTAFKSFTQNAGGCAITTYGSGSDGWYFSQCDTRWAHVKIGNSNEDVLDVGCLITSVAMTLKKYGADVSPSNIAANQNYFYLNTAYMNYRWNMNPWPNGLNSYNLSISQIDDEIKNGHPVIVGVKAGYYGQHFVVLKSIDGDDYIMHDPYYGPDKKFSEHYSKGQIFSAETFK